MNPNQQPCKGSYDYHNGQVHPPEENANDLLRSGCSQTIVQKVRVLGDSSGSSFGVQFLRFWKMFILQMIQYCLCCISYRAMAQGRYLWTLFPDLIFATLAYLIIQGVAKATDKITMAGYILGGAAGSQIAIWFTKLIFGQ